MVEESHETSAEAITAWRRSGEDVVSEEMKMVPTEGEGDDARTLWLACHAQVRRFSALLLRLEGHLQTHGYDEEARQAAQSIRRYFNQAAPLHHQDEAEDLFPALLALSGQGTVAAQHFLEEHSLLELLWRQIDADLQAQRLDADVVKRFAEAYARHAQDEEDWALPLFAELPATQLQRIGERMVARRTCKS